MCAGSSVTSNSCDACGSNIHSAGMCPHRNSKQHSGRLSSVRLTMHRHRPLVLSVFKSPFYTVLLIYLYRQYYCSVTVHFCTVHLHRPMAQFSLSHNINCKSVCHYTSTSSLDVEMMCVIYCTLLYDHIVTCINVNAPEG